MAEVRAGVEELPKTILKIQDPSTLVLKRPMNLIEKFLWEVSKIEGYVEYLCQTNQKADLSIFIKKINN